MKTIISHKNIKTKVWADTLTPNYEHIFVAYNEDVFEENNEFKLKESNLAKLFNVLNFSFDGEIYWFQKQDRETVLSLLETWFKNPDNHTEEDYDYGLYNCFFIKETPNGIAILDTQLDTSSTIDSFLSLLESTHPNIQYKLYSDAHLIDNLHLGRDSYLDKSFEEFENLYHLYKEKVINISFLSNGFYLLTNQAKHNYYNNLFSTDKEIVITGDLGLPRQRVLSSLQEAHIKVGNSINKNSWLWIGENPGNDKLNKAQQLGVRTNTIEEVIETIFQKYLQQKQQIQNTSNLKSKS